MAKEWAKAFYHGSKWRPCKDGYIDHRMSIDGGMCEVCHERLGYIVHHKIPLTPQNINNPEIALNWDNLSYECKECHDQHEGHRVGVKTKPIVCFDDDGNVISILPEFDRERT